jgi:hypothetical protein
MLKDVLEKHGVLSLLLTWERSNARGVERVERTAKSLSAGGEQRTSRRVA